MKTATVIEYGKLPRRRCRRRLILAVLIASVAGSIWYFCNPISTTIADTYADWQYERAFDRAWRSAQLPSSSKQAR